jgi:hypothetical protein
VNGVRRAQVTTTSLGDLSRRDFLEEGTGFGRESDVRCEETWERRDCAAHVSVGNTSNAEAYLKTLWMNLLGRIVCDGSRR